MTSYRIYTTSDNHIEIQCDTLTRAIKQANYTKIYRAEVKYYPGGRWLTVLPKEIQEALLIPALAKESKKV